MILVIANKELRKENEHNLEHYEKVSAYSRLDLRDGSILREQR